MTDTTDAVRNLHAGMTGHEIVPVESIVTGDVLAYLCVTCDRQMGTEKRTPPNPGWSRRR